jgi:hypothetical protein
MALIAYFPWCGASELRTLLVRAHDRHHSEFPPPNKERTSRWRSLEVGLVAESSTIFALRPFVKAAEQNPGPINDGKLPQERK